MRCPFFLFFQMRACYGGNRELALKLYNRRPQILQLLNSQGENCLAIAKSSGNHDIATVLECLEAARILESKNDSYLSITPQDLEEEKQFLKPFEIKKSNHRTKSLDEYFRNSPHRSCSSSFRTLKLRSCSPFCTSSGSSSPVMQTQQQQQQQPLIISTIAPSENLMQKSGSSGAAVIFSSSSTSTMTRKQLLKRASFDLSLAKSNREHHQRSFR